MARALPPTPFDCAWPTILAGPDRRLPQARRKYRAPESLVHQRVELRWDRDRVWITHKGQTVSSYERSYKPRVWQPAPRMRPEPPPPIERAPVPVPEIVPPALADYAELCR